MIDDELKLLWKSIGHDLFVSCNYSCNIRVQHITCACTHNWNARHFLLDMIDIMCCPHGLTIHNRAYHNKLQPFKCSMTMTPCNRVHINEYWYPCTTILMQLYFFMLYNVCFKFVYPHSFHFMFWLTACTHRNSLYFLHTWKLYARASTSILNC